MRVILDVLHGPRKGRTFVFNGHDTFIVGRSQFAHCPIPEDSTLCVVAHSGPLQLLSDVRNKGQNGCL